MKKIALLLAVLTLCLFITGCFGTTIKTFSKVGLSITLTNGFYERDYISYTAVYESKDVAVFILKEDFSLQEGFAELSLEEYADIVVSANKKESEVLSKDGLTYFTFDNNSEGKEFTYFAYLYKSSDAFWIVQFACEKEKAPSKEKDIHIWAESVKFE